MRISAILTSFLIVWLSNSAVQAGEVTKLTLPKIQVQPIKDSQSNKQYELYIKLPENYSKHQDKTFPVIYFTDAIWHVELLSGATEYIMEDAILVGISWQKDIPENLEQKYGAHFSRFGDYTFKKRKHPNIQFGQASSHLRFIREDVFKYIEKNYRTQPNNRTYFGFSAGGLFGTYALMAQPESFKNYILGSPSVRGDVADLFALENSKLKTKDLAINVFISYGELETKMIPHVEEFISTLKNNQYRGISSIQHSVIKSSGHSDSFPQVGVESVKWLSNMQPKEKE